MKKLFCFILICCMLSGCTGTNIKETSAVPEKTEKLDTQNLSGKKAGWGFRKIKGERPEFTKEQTSAMENFDCIYMGCDETNIYLTFDEGYENGYTEQILDTLRKHGVKAAFFITGPYLEKNEDIVDIMIRDGHIVGNHTINHPSIPEKSAEEIKKEVDGLSDLFYEKYGKKMKYLRPPMGEYSEKSLAITKNMGYTNVFWSFAYKDWETDNQKGKDYAVGQVLEYLHNGAVILLHAVSKDNADAMEEIILKAQEMGYVFKSLDEYN